MHDAVRHHLDPFLDKIETREKLTKNEREAVRTLPQKVVRTSTRAHIVEEGGRPTHTCMVLEGLVYRSKLAADGRRQIMSFHVPGDMVDLHTVLFKVADHTIETARHAAVVLVPHAAILQVAQDHPAVGRAFWYDTLVDASIQREALLNIGRRDARARTAHLLCELATRLKRIVDKDGIRFELPITQTEIADALGLTPIHTNRVLAALRREGLIATDGHTVTIRDWQALVAAGEFDSTYLHLEGPSELHL